MKAARIFAPLLALSLILSGCGEKPKSETVFAMNTVMELTVYGGDEALAAAKKRIAELERRLSVTDPESEIYALNRDGGGVVSEDTAELLSGALKLCRLTDGALDISIYPVLRAWGFTTDEYGVPSDETLIKLLERVDYTRVELDTDKRSVRLQDGMEIDLGSVAKGYTGDEIVSLLRENGVSSALLNLGGNVQALGAKTDGSPWRIAVKNPSGGDYIGILEIIDKAVVTSGGYERCFEENGEIYWHIIDPADGKPAKNGLISVTVVGDSGLMCDGLSTALFVMGAEKAADFWRENGGFEAVFVSDSGEISITEGLKDSFSPYKSSDSEGIRVIRRD